MTLAKLSLTLEKKQKINENTNEMRNDKISDRELKEIVTLKEWMLHAKQEQREQHRLWLMRSVYLALGIARTISLMCADSARESRHHSQEEEFNSSRDTEKAEYLAILDIDDISVHLSDQSEIRDITIKYADRHESKKGKCLDSFHFPTKAPPSNFEDGFTTMEKCKLFTLGYILEQLFQSVAPFPTLGLDYDDNKGTETSLCPDDDHCLDPPTKRRNNTKSTMIMEGLKESGIPFALSELVENLLLTTTLQLDKNDSCGYTKESERENQRFSSEHNRYNSMKEVIADLELILSDPEKYLFDYAYRDGNTSSRSKTGKGGKGFPFKDGKIYGRESHISQLLDVYDRNLGQQQSSDKISASLSSASITHREIVLISGYSGSGKSSLVSHTIRERGFHVVGGADDSIEGNDNSTINDCRSTGIHCGDNINKNNITICFLSGKFDERMHQTQPLHALVSAFDGYCDALLRKTISGLEDVRKSLGDTLGSDSKVLTGLIPNLNKVLCPPADQGYEEENHSLPSLNTPPSNMFNERSKTTTDKNTSVVKVNGQEARNRLKFLFRKFIHAIARPTQPIVLFLDDLQWVDETSLEVIYSSVVQEQQESKLSHFLFVGCYRDNQVSEGRTLNEFIQRIQKEGVTITNIPVNNMAREDVNNMLSDILHLLPRLTKPLADTVHSKTNGNPLFVRQFISSLVENGSLRYSPSVRRWTWDCDSICCEHVADDVAQLLTKKMCRIESSVQHALVVAACFGSYSERPILQKLDLTVATRKEGSLDNKQDLCNLLDKAVTDGLMTKVGSSLYRFPHDMIQSAAYSLTPNVNHVHLNIGRQLWNKCTDMEIDRHIFVIATQMNEGSNLIIDQKEKIMLAALNLRAGEKCIEKTAFVLAMLYLQKGIKLLDDRDWQGHYDLCLKMHTNFAEVLCAGGHWVEMRVALGKVFKRAHSFEDKIPSFFTLIQSLGLQNKMPLAITSSLDVLAQLGETFPDEVGRVMIDSDLHHTQVILEGFTMERIAASEEMQDTNKIAAMKFLTILSLYLYYGRRQNLVSLVIFRMVRLSLIHGVCKESAYAFAAFGWVVLNLRNDIRTGYNFGRVALSLLERFKAREYAARVHFIVYGMINVWKEPLQACLEGLVGAYDVGISTGEVFFSSTVGSLTCLQSLHCGLPLGPLIIQMRSILWNVKESKQELNLPFILSYLQTALNLSDCPGDPTELTGEVMDQNTALAAAVENENYNVVTTMYYLQMWIAYLFGRYELAGEMLEQCQSASQYGSGQRMRNGIIVNETFYGGLVALAKAQKTNERKWRTEACKSIEKVKVWAETAPWNYEHKLKLLQAELLSFDRKIDMAKQIYNESIDTARKHHFIHEEALACERAGIFHTTLENHITANEYFFRSHQLYMSWGAKSKANYVLSQYLVS